MVMLSDLTVRSVSAAEPNRPLERAVVAPAPIPDVVAPVTPNPRLRLDGSLGMVVIEFRGTAGEVANTVPSSRAIAAYRAAALTDAPVPVGVRPRYDTSLLPRESVAAPGEAAPEPVAAPAPPPAPSRPPPPTTPAPAAPAQA